MINKKIRYTIPLLISGLIMSMTILAHGEEHKEISNEMPSEK